MSTLHYNKQLFIAGLIFTLHNTEEVFGFRQFRYPEGILNHIPHGKEMTTAIVLITLIAWIAIIWTTVQTKTDPKKFLLTTLVTAFLFNAFIPHILGAIYFGGYFPAVVTAVALYLPYVYCILPKLYDEFETRKAFLRTVAQGISLALFLVFLTQTAGYLICKI